MCRVSAGGLMWWTQRLTPQLGFFTYEFASMCYYRISKVVNAPYSALTCSVLISQNNRPLARGAAIQEGLRRQSGSELRIGLVGVLRLDVDTSEIWKRCNRDHTALPSYVGHLGFATSQTSMLYPLSGQCSCKCANIVV